jgi:uncharacterized glyoxalase superfamily protein PhnB
MAMERKIHTLTPHLTVREAKKAMEFYKRAFGAEEVQRHAGPDGRIMHATMAIGDSVFMLNDEYPEMGGRAPVAIGGTAVALTLNFDSAATVDGAWKRAVDAGATVKMPLDNQFWGGRYGMLEDPSGHRWAFHAQVEQPSEEEVNRRAVEAMKAHK